MRLYEIPVRIQHFMRGQEISSQLIDFVKPEKNKNSISAKVVCLVSSYDEVEENYTKYRNTTIHGPCTHVFSHVLHK